MNISIEMSKNVLIIIIASLLVFTSLFSFFTLDKAGHQEVSIDYELEINMNQSQNYSIRVPMPSRVDSIEIVNGQGEYTTWETEYGKALCVESDSNITVEAKYYEEGNEIWDDLQTRGQENPFYLTLESENRNFWIFSESNHPVDIDLTYIQKTEDPYVVNEIKENLNHSLLEGWNEYRSDGPPPLHGDKFGIFYNRARSAVIGVNVIIANIIVWTTYYYKKKKD